MTMGWITDMDMAILDAIHDHASSALDTVMSSVTHIGDSALIFMAFGAILMISPKYRRYGVAIILASALCYIIGNLTIKPIVGRLRPFEIDPSVTLIIDHPRGFSFPSGHAMTSFAWATVLCCIPMRPLVKAVPIALASLISFSRLYLYVHYPSDVIVGAFIGIVIGLFSMYLVQKLIDRRERKEQYVHQN